MVAVLLGRELPALDGLGVRFDGLSEDTAPFSKAFGNARGEMREAIESYAGAVRNGEFPAEEHSHYEEDVEDVY